MKKLKNPLNPTPRQIILRHKAWAKALQENPKKAKGTLRCGDGRCCLGVAEDVAIELGLDIEKSHGGHALPSVGVSQFFGWGDRNPNLVSDNSGKLISAAYINDALDLPHIEIAECVLNTFVRKTPIWNK